MCKQKYQVQLADVAGRCRRRSAAMIRREARLRREFLYRKSLEGKQAAEYERRRAVREALAEGREVPTELRNKGQSLYEKDKYADALHDAPTSHQDDEYAQAALTDPRIVITTSRDPSAKLMQFAKELRLLFPNAQRLNRGNLVVSELVATSRANEITDIIVAHENRGQPDGLIVSHLPYGPTAFFNLSNVVMRHDIRDQDLGTMSEAYPHQIFHDFNTKLGQRLSTILKHLFPVPKLDSKRIMTFVNSSDVVSFRHHVYETAGKAKNKDQIELQEVGPRFEMQVYQIRLGTLDQIEADDEWVLRPFMNTAKTRRALG